MKPFLLFILICSTAPVFAQSAKDFYDTAEKAEKEDKNEAALILISKAIHLDSMQADYYSLKGHVLIKLKLYQEAIQTYDQAVAMFPKEYNAYNNRGNLLLRFGEFDLSINDFNKAIELATTDSLKHHFIVNRAAAKMSKRDFESAYNDLITAYNFDSTDLAALTNLGAVCDEVGRGDETLKYLLKAVETHPEAVETYVNIGFKYQEMGDFAKAIRCFDKVLQHKPDEPLAFSNRSYNKLRLGDISGAMSDIQKSIELYPANSYAYKNRALVYIKSGKIEAACEDLQTALDKGFEEMYGEEVSVLKQKYCH